MTYEFDQIADAIRDEMESIAREAIVQAKDTGDIIGPADIDDVVRDLISNMDTSDFVDTDTVVESVIENYSFSEAVGEAVSERLAYEGIDDCPANIEALEERLNDLEGNPAATDNDGYNALVNTVTELSTRVNRIEEGGTEHDVTNLMDANRNLTERIVYMEGIINALVDTAAHIVDYTDGYGEPKPRTDRFIIPSGTPIPPAAEADTDDTAPYAAI